MINVALAGDFALNLHALASLFHPLPGIRVVSISRNPASLVRALSASGPASAASARESLSIPAAALQSPSAAAADPAAAPVLGSASLLDSSSVPVYPQVVLLDVNFELRPATQVITFIKESHPTIRLIVLGLTRDEEAIDLLFRAGADRHLPKNADPLLLEQAIREVVACDITPSTQTAPAFSTWPTVTDAEYRYYKLAISDVSNADIRKTLRICDSCYTRLVQQTYDRFNVRSRDGLAVALFRQRWWVRDDL